MAQQRQYRSTEEVLDDLEQFIREFEIKYGCSTEVMQQQFQRRLIEGQDFTAWNMLAELRDKFNTRRNENEISNNRMELC